jgi:hypothetical protein
MQVNLFQSRTKELQMESLLFIAAFIGSTFNADAAGVAQLLMELSRLNARLVSLAKQSRLTSSGGFSPDEERVYVEAQNLVTLFQKNAGVWMTQKNAGVCMTLCFNGPGSAPVSDSRLRLEFPKTAHDESAPLYIQSLAGQLRDAEEENWELVRDMLGYRVGLNIIDEHTEAFESLSESNVEYIEGKIRDGYTEGEMFESLSIDEADLRGYWKILS